MGYRSRGKNYRDTGYLKKDISNLGMFNANFGDMRYGIFQEKVEGIQDTQTPPFLMGPSFQF